MQDEKNIFISIVLFIFFFSFSSPPPTDCVLYAVGKPVYHKSTNVTYGSWLKDAHPRNKEFGEKIWTTYETHHTIIFEFTDKTSFRNNHATELRLKSPGFQVCVGLEYYNFLLFLRKGCFWFESATIFDMTRLGWKRRCSKWRKNPTKNLFGIGKWMGSSFPSLPRKILRSDLHRKG